MANNSGQYFTTETLENTLGQDGQRQLKSITINPGENFLSGKQTNSMLPDNSSENTSQKSENKDLALAEELVEGITVSAISKTTSKVANKITSNKTVASTIQLGAAGLGAYGVGRSIYENRDEIIQSLSTLLVSKVTDIVIKEATKSTSKYLANHAAAAMKFPAKVATYTTEYFNENKISLAEVLSSLNKEAEDRAEDANKESTEKKKKKFISNIQKFSKNFADYINTAATKGTEFISDVTSYMENGPEWISDQIDKQIGSLMSGINKKIDAQWKKDEEKYDELARQLGSEAGSALVSKYNKSLYQAQKKKLEKTKKLKTKLQITMFSLKAKAASLLGSQLGTYIPVV